MPEKFLPDGGSLDKAKAGLVHVLTAFGSIIGLLACAAAVQGEWTTVQVLILLAVAIDSADGTLARKLKVKQTIPRIDGALMDNLVDFINYCFLPAFILLFSNLLPVQARLAAASLLLLSSCYQFSQTDAKTRDCYFRGFPSYWNVLVVYLFLLETSAAVNLAAIIAFAILVFIPIYYVYPSRTPTLRSLTLGLSAAWLLLILSAVLLQPAYAEASRLAALFSLLFIVYYLALSLFLSAKRYGFI